MTARARVSRRSVLPPRCAGSFRTSPASRWRKCSASSASSAVVKLASNEGPYGPFPAALEAIARSTPELNRYPDGGAYRLRAALAERHGVAFEEVITGAGADGMIDCLSQIFLEPGDEIVCCWPSFISYVIAARKLGATPRLVPLRDHRYDLDAMLDAIGPRTKLAYLCLPNNPTGTANTRAEVEAWFDRVPEHVTTVVDQAYFEYIDSPDYVDAVAEYFAQGRNVVVLRTFSKIYGLAGLRVGYGVAPARVVTELSKVRSAFDVSTPAQEAALASLDDAAELRRRRVLNERGAASSSGCSASTASTRSRGRSRTSSSSSSARIRGPSRSGCCERARSFDRRTGSARRRRSG